MRGAKVNFGLTCLVLGMLTHPDKAGMCKHGTRREGSKTISD